MARVLVVGTDIQGEQALLQRLRVASALPDGQIRRSQDLDERLRGASVKLLRWPDFRVLGHDHDGFRLCSLLLKRACTVEECAMLLELPAAAVRDFI
ncbi:MAG: hypothetical protein AB1514_06905, partial [Pseudomonadota bacterium]